MTSFDVCPQLCSKLLHGSLEKQLTELNWLIELLWQQCMLTCDVKGVLKGFPQRFYVAGDIFGKLVSRPNMDQLHNIIFKYKFISSFGRHYIILIFFL